MTDQIEQAQSEMNKINRPTFQVEIDDNRIAVVNILSPENDANWLPENCVEELRNVIGKAIYQQVRGILFISALNFQYCKAKQKLNSNNFLKKCN